MGKLIEGKWHDIWYETKENNGNFVREDAGFRHFIEDKSSAQFQPESNRYHLYISLACPWAHRTLIFRTLKNLESHIEVTIVSPDMMENGWIFEQPEPLYSATCLHQIYTRAKPNYTGRVTVPVLWDKKNKTIVSNESAEIIRMFNSEFNQLTGNFDDYYPMELRDEIERWNRFIYPNINNGVYRAGFATNQDAYLQAYNNLFDALDKIDARLSGNHYLVGERLTEADWRLFTTLIRFDAVYVGHFKCNKRRIMDYKNLSRYLRMLYDMEGIKQTVDIEQIKRHYYFSHKSINPTQIVPIGPDSIFATQ